MRCNTINLLICGLTGRMGREIFKLTRNSDFFFLVGGTCSFSESKKYSEFDDVNLKKNLSNLIFEFKNLKNMVVIDFSISNLAYENAFAAHENGLPLIICSSGISKYDLSKINDLGAGVPIVFAPNTSFSANLMAFFVKIASEKLPDADVGILEIHHRKKKDRISGTSFHLRDIIRFADKNKKDRVVDLSSLRVGDEKGRHDVCFFSNNETLKISHNVSDRSIFAKGALSAAKYIVNKKPGFYTMFDVFGLN